MSKNKNKLEYLSEKETDKYIDELLEKAQQAREKLESKLKESEQKEAKKVA